MGEKPGLGQGIGNGHVGQGLSTAPSARSACRKTPHGSDECSALSVGGRRIAVRISWRIAESYQRLPPRPPPPPRLSRPPPPPPPDSRGLASLTLRLRPLRSLPSNSAIALAASPELSISTKPKPLDWPENLSDTTAALAIFPTCEKSPSRSSFVTEWARLPTYNLLGICCPP